MKYYIAFLLVLVAASSRAQITLEHTYATTPALTQVDSGLSKYIFLSSAASAYGAEYGAPITTYTGFSIYNLNHTLDQTIQLPALASDQIYDAPQFISKKLFDLDGLYDYLVVIEQLTKFTPQPPDTGSAYWVTTEYITRSYDENGKQLFSSDSANGSSIFNTEGGTKLLLTQWSTPGASQYVQFSSSGTSVYSLPGKLPSPMRTPQAGVIPSSIAGGSGPIPTSAYPNPSNGQLRVAYTLPVGVATGELVVTDVQGHEVKSYRVGNAFNDILLSKSDLPSGSYFYKIVTEKGDSNPQRLVVVK